MLHLLFSSMNQYMNPPSYGYYLKFLYSRHLLLEPNWCILILQLFQCQQGAWCNAKWHGLQVNCIPFSRRCNQFQSSLTVHVILSKWDVQKVTITFWTGRRRPYCCKEPQNVIYIQTVGRGLNLLSRHASLMERSWLLLYATPPSVVWLVVANNNCLRGKLIAL